MKIFGWIETKFQLEPECVMSFISGFLQKYNSKKTNGGHRESQATTPFVINWAVWYRIRVSRARARSFSVINWIHTRTHKHTHTCADCISAKTRHRQHRWYQTVTKENGSNPLEHFPYPHHYSYDYLLFGVWHLTWLSIDNAAIESCTHCIWLSVSIYPFIWISIMWTLRSIIICNFAFFPFIFPFFSFGFFFSLYFVHRYSVCMRSICTHTHHPILLHFAFSYQHTLTIELFIHSLYLITSMFPHSICLCRFRFDCCCCCARIRIHCSFSHFPLSNFLIHLVFSSSFVFDWVMLCTAAQYSRHDGRGKRNSSTSRDPRFKLWREKVSAGGGTWRRCQHQKVMHCLCHSHVQLNS